MRADEGTNLTNSPARRARSSQTGQFVGEEYAKANPDTTQVEVDTTSALKRDIRAVLDDGGTTDSEKLAAIERLIS